MRGFHRMWSFHLILAACVAFGASAQSPRVSSATSPGAATLVQMQLEDTSFIQRSVALDRLRHGSRTIRHEAAYRFALALGDTSRVRRARALAGLRVLGSDGAPAVAALDQIARSPGDALRGQAISALGAMGPAAASALATIRVASTDTANSIRIQAAASLVALGDTAPAKAAYRLVLRSDANKSTRLIAARALAGLSDTVAMPALQEMLADTAFQQRTGAATALGLLGPRASAAIPALTAMLSDTVRRRMSQGQAAEVESAAAFAAWALGRIIPFHSVVMNTVLDPLYARVADSLFSLRSDGLGTYAWGIDSGSVWMGSGFFLHMSPPSEGRGPIGPEREGLRRSLSFDLSAPVAGSDATGRGVVRDNEAYIWIWYRRNPSTDRVTTVREIDVSDSVRHVERIEMHFRIGGVLHVLQMGPFVEGQGGAGAWLTGMNGNGTSLGQLIHSSTSSWIVRAPPGSVARLWSFEDRAHPIDRGLYEFSLQIQFTAIPNGPSGACVPSLTCS